MRKKSLPELPLEPPIWLGNKSNGEYFHEQTEYDRRLRAAILKKADENARRIGWGRREFLASSMGMATSLWVINQMGCGEGGEAQSSGPYEVPPDAMLDTGADSAGVCTPLDTTKEFIIDLQTHHVNPAGPWRQTNSIYQIFINSLPQSMCGEMDGIECLSAKHYIEEMFINSDTTMSVLSSIPAAPCINGMTAGCDTPLRNDEIAATRDLVNSKLARSQRMLNHVMVMPNLDWMQQSEEMAAMQSMFGVGAWKCYTPWGPGGVGWYLDDPVGLQFIQRGVDLDVKVFCCHKGLPLPTFDSVHTDPRDVGVVATMFPDVSFIIYHSAFRHGGSAAEGPYDPTDYRGVNSLIKTLEDAGIGKDSNVYAELGSLWGSVMTDGDQAQHVIGKLLKHVGENNVVWGTDCIWTGSPQSQIDAFRMFTITPAFQQMYGYPELTDDIKRKIFGLNAAKIFGIDVAEQRCAISKSDLEMAKLLLNDEFGPRRWVFNTPAGPRTRQEFLNLARLNRDLPG
jgi:hypothetical protein